MAKKLNRYYTKEYTHTHIANKHMKTCSASSVIRKLQIKIPMRYYKRSNKMAKNKMSGHTKCW